MIVCATKTVSICRPAAWARRSWYEGSTRMTSAHHSSDTLEPGYTKEKLSSITHRITWR